MHDSEICSESISQKHANTIRGSTIRESELDFRAPGGIHPQFFSALRATNPFVNVLGNYIGTYFTNTIRGGTIREPDQIVLRKDTANTNRRSTIQDFELDSMYCGRILLTLSGVTLFRKSHYLGG